METKPAKKGFLQLGNLSTAKHRHAIAKVLSVAVVATMGLVGIGFYKSNIVQYQQSALNWQFASMLGMLFLTFMLSACHGEIYWVRYFKKLKMDERQAAVRRRVYEKSYIILSLLVLLTIVFVPSMINDFTQSIMSSGQLNVPVFEVIMFVYALPSIVASWQKDA